MFLGKVDIHIQKNKVGPFEHYLTPYIKINSKWIKDLNVRPKSIKLFEENLSQNLHNVGFCTDFLDMTLKELVTNGKTDKLNPWIHENFSKIVHPKTLSTE